MDISLYYIEEGQGKPLILLHGNGEDHTYFVHQIRYFSRMYRRISFPLWTPTNWSKQIF